MGCHILIKLICGRSRAGKTTYSKQFDNVIHLDFCSTYPSKYESALKKVEKQQGDVIIEGIYNTAERRTALLESYKGDGKRVCIWLDTPLDIIESRFFNSKAYKLPHPFEPPTYSEGWDEIIIIRGDYEQSSSN